MLKVIAVVLLSLLITTGMRDPETIARDAHKELMEQMERDLQHNIRSAKQQAGVFCEPV